MEIPEFALDPHNLRGKALWKKLGRSWKDRVIIQQESLNPQPKTTELYQEMLDKIDAIMTKKKNKEKIEDK
jgi:hypothetical protein